MFVGDVYAAHNSNELKKQKITHVVNVACGVAPAYPDVCVPSLPLLYSISLFPPFSLFRSFFPHYAPLLPQLLSFPLPRGK